MPKAAVIVAMEREQQLLSSASIPCTLSGIGKVNAARVATKLAAQRPDFIISTGCAGAMQPELNVGDILIADRVAYHDVWCGKGNAPGQVQGLPLCYEADKRLLEAATSLNIEGLHRGLLVSGDQFFISLEEDRRILSIHPDALACDMESAAIAQVCELEGIPFLSLRTISDTHTPATEKNHNIHYEEFWDKIAVKSFETIMAILKAL